MASNMGKAPLLRLMDSRGMENGMAVKGSDGWMNNNDDKEVYETILNIYRFIWCICVCYLREIGCFVNFILI